MRGLLSSIGQVSAILDCLDRAPGGRDKNSATLLQLAELWKGNKRKPEWGIPPDSAPYSKAECERRIVLMLVEGALDQTYKFSPYAVNSYIIKGAKGAGVDGRVRAIVSFWSFFSVAGSPLAPLAHDCVLCCLTLPPRRPCINPKPGSGVRKTGCARVDSILKEKVEAGECGKEEDTKGAG